MAVNAIMGSYLPLLRRFGLCAVLICLTTTLVSTRASAQSESSEFEVWNALNKQTIGLFQEGLFEDAEAAARSALIQAETHLQDHSAELGSSHFNLGAVLQRLGKYDEASAAHQNALAIRLAMDPVNDHDIATSLESIAETEQANGNARSAAEFYRRAVGAKSALGQDTFFVQRGHAYALFGLDDRSSDETLEALDAMRHALATYGDRKSDNLVAYANDLANAIQLARTGERLFDVVDLAQELVDLRRAERPQDAYELGWAYRYLAETHETADDIAGAETAYRAAISQMEKLEGGLNYNVSNFSFALGDLLETAGRYAEAERAFRQTLVVEQQIYGDAHEETLRTYNRLGLLLHNDGRYFPSEVLLRRGLALSETVHGPDALWTATIADNLALALTGLGRLNDAIPLHRRALEIRQDQLGRVNETTSKTVNNLALALEATGNTEEARELFREALNTDRQTLPEGSWEIGVALTNLADSLVVQGTPSTLAEAYDYLREALDITRLNYPPKHANIAEALDSLAMLAMRAARFSDASEYLLEAADIYSAPQNRNTLVENSVTFDAAMGILLSQSDANAAAAFELAQWPLQTAASKAIADSALRAAAKNPELSGMVRRMQDLNAKNSELNELALVALGSDDETERGRVYQALADVEHRISELQTDLDRQFPNFSQYQGGEPADTASVAAVLQPDEALVFIRPGHTRTNGQRISGAIFVVSPNGVVTSALLERGNDLQQDAEVLLCSVHAGVNDCPAPSETAHLTRGLFSVDSGNSKEAEPKEFNLALAHDLYQRTLGKVDNALSGARRLIIVPGDETLAALPFQILLTDPAPSFSEGEAAAYSGASWLVRKWAVTVLPNVSALTNGRGEEPSQGRGTFKRFLGIGDPVIGARRTIDCGPDDALVTASLQRSVMDAQTNTLWRGNSDQARVADVDAVRQLASLPDTRCELEQIARSLGGGTLLLQEAANETRVKAMSKEGALFEFDVISFATHGLVAGEIQHAEPALVLTPPTHGSLQDDGLITAGEIAQLDLNAEWVLLSACNTAAGRVSARDGTAQNESFSGLARAFFYAGARNLLVSHWPVQSPAAVQITTKTFDALADDPATGKAVAFQTAMLSILEDPDAADVTLHPRYWAPFTLLGHSP